MQRSRSATRTRTPVHSLQELDATSLDDYVPRQRSRQRAGSNPREQQRIRSRSRNLHSDLSTNRSRETSASVISRSQIIAIVAAIVALLLAHDSLRQPFKQPDFSVNGFVSDLPRVAYHGLAQTGDYIKATITSFPGARTWLSFLDKPDDGQHYDLGDILQAVSAELDVFRHIEQIKSLPDTIGKRFHSLDSRRGAVETCDRLAVLVWNGIASNHEKLWTKLDALHNLPVVPWYWGKATGQTKAISKALIRDSAYWITRLDRWREKVNEVEQINVVFSAALQDIAAATATQLRIAQSKQDDWVRWTHLPILDDQRATAESIQIFQSILKQCSVGLKAAELLALRAQATRSALIDAKICLNSRTPEDAKNWEPGKDELRSVAYALTDCLRAMPPSMDMRLRPVLGKELRAQGIILPAHMEPMNYSRPDSQPVVT